jgi:dipeptidase D
MAAETAVTGGLEPRSFWAQFEALTRIPRPSRGEEAVVEHVRSWAAERCLDVAQDDAGNLVVAVPATPGRAAAASVILQGHLDMVCERDPASPNDPAEGRIVLVRDGDWVSADGTTLGADNGVAIAAMMALVDEGPPHGPLELLMTVAEEVGLEGANALDGSLLTGSVLLNLDSGEGELLTVGCAGSTDTWIHLTAGRERVEGAVMLAVAASGGRGGHSGSEIALGRSNAIKVLGRALREAHAAVPFSLVSLDGGKSRNAIPRDAVGIVSVAAGREDAFCTAIEAASATVRDAFAKSDPAVTITASSVEATGDPWSRSGTERMLDAVALVPTGPIAMSPDFLGLVETSTSLGEARTDGDRLALHSLSRSSNDSALPEVIATLEGIARLSGGRLEVQPNYGAWRPNLDSSALAVATDLYDELFGERPGVTVMHGGLEPAVIGGKLPRLDMLSFGPQIELPHSPEERLSISSVERFWALLVALVDRLSADGRAAAVREPGQSPA